MATSSQSEITRSGHCWTGGSLSVKLVEKSLLDLFTDDVLQSVDRSHGKDSGNSRKKHAFDDDDDDDDDDDPYVDEDGHFLRMKMSCLTLTMTWPSMTRNTTMASWVIARRETP